MEKRRMYKDFEQAQELQEGKRAPLTKEEVNRCRHKAEKRWYRRLIVLNIIIVLSVCGLFLSNFEKNYEVAEEKINTTMESMKEEWKQVREESKEDTKQDTDTKASKKERKENEVDEKKKASKEKEKGQKNFTDDLEWFVLGALTLLLFPLVLNIFYASYRSMAIRITPKNFPEVYRLIEQYAERIGLKKVPPAYIMQQNGILNAFSAFIFRKQYIEIAADLFEVAYREHKDMNALGFVIAHELAHIRLKHATFGYNIWILFSNSIPILGSTASRAREYSCDRLAQKVTGESGLEAMAALMAGKHLYKDVDIEDYLEQAKEVRGFCVWCYNLSCSHPVMTKRMRALADGEGSGKLY